MSLSKTLYSHSASLHPGVSMSTVQRRKWSPDRKWSPNWTANDPEPQMIPDVDRKWSRRKTRNGMEFGFPDFFLIFVFIYVHQLNDELD